MRLAKLVVLILMTIHPPGSSHKSGLANQVFYEGTVHTGKPKSKGLLFITSGLDHPSAASGAIISSRGIKRALVPSVARTRRSIRHRIRMVSAQQTRTRGGFRLELARLTGETFRRRTGSLVFCNLAIHTRARSMVSLVLARFASAAPEHRHDCRKLSVPSVEFITLIAI